MPITLTAMCAGMIASHPSCRPAIQSDNRFPVDVLFALNLALISVFPIGQSLIEISRIIVAALLVGTLGAGARNSLLASAPLQFLGRVSFSLYLLNVPIILLLSPIVKDLISDSLVAGTALGVTTTLLTLPFAHLSEKYVERPGILAGNALIAIVSRGALSIFKRAPVTSPCIEMRRYRTPPSLP
jgi:peptidoglycan/LPS O-acetylase OafA/YrhL